MSENNETHEHFKFSYRADCITCQKYVGKKRKVKQEAEQDGKSHKNISENQDHDVRIEVTQAFHLF